MNRYGISHPPSHYTELETALLEIMQDHTVQPFQRTKEIFSTLESYKTYIRNMVSNEEENDEEEEEVEEEEDDTDGESSEEEQKERPMLSVFNRK